MYEFAYVTFFVLPCCSGTALKCLTCAVRWKPWRVIEGLVVLVWLDLGICCDTESSSRGTKRQFLLQVLLYNVYLVVGKVSKEELISLQTNPHALVSPKYAGCGHNIAS